MFLFTTGCCPRGVAALGSSLLAIGKGVTRYRRYNNSELKEQKLFVKRRK